MTAPDQGTPFAPPAGCPAAPVPPPPPPGWPVQPPPYAGQGYPPPQGYPPHGWQPYGMPATAQNGKGSNGMVLGILACCLWWIPFLYLVTAVPMGILAIVFGNQGRRLCEQGLATNPGQCTAALWTGIVALSLCFLSALVGILLAF